MASFCSGPGTGASGESVSPPTTGLEKSHQWPGVSVGNQHPPPHSFLNEATAGTPRHVCRKFHVNIRRSDCVGSISNHVQRPKSIPCWKLSRCVTTQSTRVFRTIVRKFTPFLGDKTLKFGTTDTCSVSPYPAVDESLFFSFFAGNFGSLKTQISKKINIKIYGEKNKSFTAG